MYRMLLSNQNYDLAIENSDNEIPTIENQNILRYSGVIGRLMNRLRSSCLFGEESQQECEDWLQRCQAISLWLQHPSYVS